MTKAVLSEQVFDYLVEHLVDMEDGKNKLLDELFPRALKERLEFETRLENYIRQIDILVRKAEKSSQAGNELPFVIIGSEIEMQSLSDKEIHKYRIVAPFGDSVGDGDISCMSPVGKSSLLRKVGDVIEVKAPGGVFHYKIKSIRLRLS